MCSVDLYGKYHVTMSSDANNGSGRPIPSASSKNHFSHMIVQSTVLTIGFNPLKKIIRTESLFIKLIWVSYLKQSQNHFLQKR